MPAGEMSLKIKELIENDELDAVLEAFIMEDRDAFLVLEEVIKDHT